MRGLFRRNVGLKLVSLVLAFVTWVIVVGRSPGVRFVNAPVEFLAPEGLTVVDYSPREVRVRLQGDAPVLDRLSEQNVYARVQVEAGLRPNRPQKIAVQDREILGVPSGVSKEIVTPALTVILERKLTKTVPVRVRITGSPPQGYRVAQATAEPQSVEVSGPDASIRAVDQIWTEPVDPKSHKRAFTAQTDLIRPPDALVTLKPDSVRVSVLIDEVPRPLELLVSVRSNDETYAPEQAYVRAVLEAPPTLAPRIRGVVVAVADASGLGGRGGPAPVRLEFPGLAADEAARIRVVLVDPARVRLKKT